MGLRAGAALGASLADAVAEVETRAATRGDLDFAFETLRASMRPYVEAAFGPWDEAEQRARFAATFDLRTHRVVRCDGEDAGLVAIETHVDRIALERLFLLPRFQGRGLGTSLVRALLRRAREEALPVRVTVLRSNPGALRFYERLGFRRTIGTRLHLHLEAD
ncbi:MAG: GNAT family N-acetyltransferase [Proteobacteria bacterium]|nr:MAG: GNAT family N-acetyltransferase [Pseudomonadota bacterium]